ncbi:acetyl-CoA carboxylase carboxyl transferase subunit beta [Streptosporangium becharense]|uniref:Multifunctional fusion protein n=1 Tax=Streptosporangium becharense TaxID=1816182 RepID=A0A7W9MK23_9ACTN|nr:acetyl-CoA carboxylase carboxyl transferase subunit beta [Streptosporangium becharense]MBB5823168.1 acetyl-CoA carboxylase carboxyl transferase subunit beta [Streptosporangium becharense]
MYGPRLDRNLGVCPECGDHGPLTAPQRIAHLLDPGSVRELPAVADDHDPLAFHDTVPYAERLDRARRATGLAEAVVCVRGTVAGHPVVAAVMDFRFLGGSLGSAVGELITRAAETALQERTPLLLVTASGGARMQEGALSLMQMAKTSQALGLLDEAGVLTISLVTDPTYGGVAASFATLCDVVVAEPGARLGFAGPRVVEQTLRSPLPPGFQSAEFLLEHGLIDLVRPRAELRPTLGRLLAAGGRAGGPPPPGDGGLVRDPGLLPDMDPWTQVRRARDLRRPTTLDYARRVLRDFEELHGDRIGGDCPAIVGGVGRLRGRPVMLIGHQKGHDGAELNARNFGMASPHGYRKAARLMRLAAKLGLPVVTLVDTPGAHPGLEAERHGQAMAIAANLRLMASLPVPVLTLIIGEGGSGGALALGVADEVLICADAVYSVISPEGCASILWRDAADAPRAAAALRLHSRELLRLGVVDAVLPEPEGGMGADHAAAAQLVERALAERLGDLVRRPAERLVRERRARFRRFGSGPPPDARPADGDRSSLEHVPLRH